MTLALIDADVLAYRAAVGAQEDIEWGDGLSAPTVDKRKAIDTAKGIVERWAEMAGADQVKLCFSSDKTIYRRFLFAAYKMGRKDKPLLYNDVVDYLQEEFPFETLPHLEGDDVMGLASSPGRKSGVVIVSIDKDMKTIPGLLLNPDKDDKPRLVTPAEADVFWMTQTLTGDRTDGYFGCSGIGPAKAAKILERCFSLPEMWEAVLGTYRKSGVTEREAIVQAQLARILRPGEFDYETGEVTLWHPRKSYTIQPACLRLSASTHRSPEVERERSQRF